MPHYIAESRKSNVLSRGTVVEGIQAHGHDGVFLYVLCTQEDPSTWPQSSHDETHADDPPRRAPPGVSDWWLVAQGARATWPDTQLRSSLAQVELAGLPGHEGKEPMIHWPLRP